MKKLFRGYFADDKDLIDSLWSDCIFVFDANILLNLYRYSDSTRNEFLHILKTIKHRIWLPNRAAGEYFKNRTKVIYDQSKSYDDSISKINALRQTFENSRSHPFISSQTKEKTEEIFGLLSDELKESKKAHSTRLTNDPIKAQLALLFEGRVGDPFSDDVLKKILNDGKYRYSEQIPPGFEDADKVDENDDSTTVSDLCRRYGDYILWSQILEFAETNKKNVILVTDDSKKDWWEIQNKTTIGPRPELIEEFFDKTGQNIFMYKPDKFLELSKQYLNESVTAEAVDEVRELRRKDQTETFSKDHSMLHSLAFDMERINKNLKDSQTEREILRKRINDTEQQYYELLSTDVVDSDVLKQVQKRLNDLVRRSCILEQEVLDLSEQRKELLDWILGPTTPNKNLDSSQKDDG